MGPRHQPLRPSPQSLLEILKLFEACPAPPGRTDIPAKYQKPTLKAIVAEYNRVAYYILRSNFISDRDPRRRDGCGPVHGRELCLLADERVGKRHVCGPGKRSGATSVPSCAALIEALPRCCARYTGASRASLESRRRQSASDARCVRRLRTSLCSREGPLQFQLRQLYTWRYANQSLHCSRPYFAVLQGR